jgi:hypothetical protein
LKAIQPGTDANLWPLVAAAPVLGLGRGGSILLILARAARPPGLFFAPLAGPGQAAVELPQGISGTARRQDQQKALAGHRTGPATRGPRCLAVEVPPAVTPARQKTGPQIQGRFSLRLEFRRAPGRRHGGKRIRQFKTDFRPRLRAVRRAYSPSGRCPGTVGPAHAAFSICAVSPAHARRPA